MTDRIRPVRSPQPLPILVQDRLIQLIKEEGVFLPGSLLPNENELVKMLGVGRGTLREALRLLEQKGLISRHPGKGTVVKKGGLLADNPLETNFSVTELIRSTHAVPGIRDVRIRVEPADCKVAGKLDVDAGTPLVVKDAVRTADGRPVVLTVNYFPLSLIAKKPVAGGEMEAALADLCRAEVRWESLYNALEHEYGISVQYGIAKVIPRVATPLLSTKLKIELGAPLLLIDQVNYSPTERPLMYNLHYWIEGVVEFTILRRRRD